MPYTSGYTVTAADFDVLLDAVTAVYSVGSGDKGYGQTTFLQPDIFQKDIVRAVEWGHLRSMLLTCAGHQGTPADSLTLNPAMGSNISAALSAALLLSSVEDNRLKFAADEMTISPNITKAVRNVNWNGVIETTIDVKFVSEDAARFFFNSGGSVGIIPTHEVSTAVTATDTSFKNFLARQVGGLTIGAYQNALNGSGNTTVDTGGYYSLTGDPVLVCSQTNTDNLSANGADYIKVYAKRTDYKGERGGNGAGIQIRVEMQCLGNSSGSFLGSGTQVSVSIARATKRLTIQTPSCANTGFNLIRKGNGTNDPTNGDPQGTVVNPTPFNPDVGTRTYTVPEYATITFELWGGGGSEGPSTGPYPRSDGAQIYLTPGVAGGDATIAMLGLVARGGTGGGFYNTTTKAAGAAGVDGTGSGGDVNTTGGGKAGGSSRYANQTTWFNGGKGGNGAYVKKTFVRGAPGAPAPGTVLTLTVPAGGSQSAIRVPNTVPTVFYPGADGVNGSVKVTYTVAGSGSITLWGPSTQAFTVPLYSTMRIRLAGAGGGQGHPVVAGGLIAAYGGWYQTVAPESFIPGGNGGDSSVSPLGLSATGGTGSYNNPWTNPRGIASYQINNGSSGYGAGGDVNQQGGGQLGGRFANSGTDSVFGPGFGGQGGDTVKSFTAGAPGAPTAGQVLTISLAAGGSAPALNSTAISQGLGNSPGDNAACVIEWTYNGAPITDTPI